MEYRQLGRTGLRVPPLCLGTMTFGLQCDEATSFAILDRAFEGGVDFIDTADVYPLGGDVGTVGRTEEIIGRWMRDRGNRNRIVLASKCAGQMGSGPNDVGLSRYHIQRAVEESLERLGTDGSANDRPLLLLQRLHPPTKPGKKGRESRELGLGEYGTTAGSAAGPFPRR